MKRKLEFAFVFLFLLANLIAPWVIGERYPFTVAPMFSDQPGQYATYRIEDDQGNELDSKPFGLHLVYDGNPPGFGMGIEPQPTLHTFGEVASNQEIRQHVAQVLRENPAYQNLPYVVVIRHHVTCQDHCLCRQDDEIRVERGATPSVTSSGSFSQPSGVEADPGDQ